MTASKSGSCIALPCEKFAKVLQKLNKKPTILFFFSEKPLAEISRFRASGLSKCLQK